MWVGLVGCSGAIAFVLLVSALAVAFALTRREGDPLRIQLEIDGAGLPSTAAVHTTYVSAADIPFLTRSLTGGYEQIATDGLAAMNGNALSIDVPDGFRSIRDEQISVVSFALPGDAIALECLSDRIEVFDPPAIHYDSLGPGCSAVLEGDVATYRTHALFLPGTIVFPRAARTIRAVIDVRPITAVQLGAGPSPIVTMVQGVPSPVRLTVRRTGADWPSATTASAPAPDAEVQAIVVSEADLVATLSWSVERTPYIPITRAQWQVLSAHADSHFTFVTTRDPDGATTVITSSIPIPGALYVVALAFGPSEDLAGAAAAEIRGPEGDESW